MYYMYYLTSLSARSKHSGIILFTATCLELKRTSEEEQTRQCEISLYTLRVVDILEHHCPLGTFTNNFLNRVRYLTNRQFS